MRYHFAAKTCPNVSVFDRRSRRNDLRSFCRPNADCCRCALNRDALMTIGLSSGVHTDRNRRHSRQLGNNIPEFFFPRRAKCYASLSRNKREKRGEGRNARRETGRKPGERGRGKEGGGDAAHHGELKMMIGGKRAASVDGGARRERRRRGGGESEEKEERHVKGY